MKIYDVHPKHQTVCQTDVNNHREMQLQKGQMKGTEGSGEGKKKEREW